MFPILHPHILSIYLASGVSFNTADFPESDEFERLVLGDDESVVFDGQGTLVRDLKNVRISVSSSDTKLHRITLGSKRCFMVPMRDLQSVPFGYRG